jgi:hypothetical protein
MLIMSSAILVMKWENYVGGAGSRPFFSQDPLTFNSRQERLHQLTPGDRLWLVSRCPDDQQYYFVGVLWIVGHRRNAPDSPEASLFGEYAVIADRAMSRDLGKTLQGDGLLRAFEFDSSKPIKYGASIGQSLQTLRMLNSSDENVLDSAFGKIQRGGESHQDCTFGLWTKCNRVFADYFLKNWQIRSDPLAFLLYDPPPALRVGSPIFIHSDQSLRLVARFLGGQYVAGHKFTADLDERIAERDRVWNTYRAGTIDPPVQSEFDTFWNGQNGVRGLFIMDHVVALQSPVAFKTYGRALEWGYPTGVGYRYLSLPQSYLLLRVGNLPDQQNELFLKGLTERS